jgi:hypothetical protein
MTTHELRSRNWFGRNDLDGFVHPSWLKAEGFSDVAFDGRPVATRDDRSSRIAQIE